MKTLLACALLALVPLSSVRIVCVEEHGSDARAAIAAGTDEPSEAERECERVCHKGTPRTPPPAVRCVLVPDPSCSFLAATAVAVLPSAAPSLGAAAAAPFEVFNPPGRSAPQLTRHGPPPRA